jgi:hypothetical protein
VAVLNSVADLGCLSRIPDTKTGTKERGEKKISFHTFLCSHKFHKVENYFSFEVLKKKIWASFQIIIELFTQKIVSKFSKIWVWDPRSGIRKKLFRIPDPGVKKAPDPGVKKAPDPDPQHCIEVYGKCGCLIISFIKC